MWPKSQEEEEQRQDNAPMEVPPFQRASQQSPNKLFDSAFIETKEEFEIEAAAARRAFWGRKVKAIPMKSGVVPEKRCSWNLIAECRSVLETKRKQISGLWQYHGCGKVPHSTAFGKLQKNMLLHAVAEILSGPVT